MVGLDDERLSSEEEAERVDCKVDGVSFTFECIPPRCRLAEFLACEHDGLVDNVACDWVDVLLEEYGADRVI